MEVCFQKWCHYENQHGCHLNIVLLESNSRMLSVNDLKFDRIVVHHLAKVDFEIDASMYAHLSVNIRFLDSNSKRLLLIDLKLDNVVGHNLD